MATWIWVNIGSGNGLLADGTKPISEPMLTNHQWLVSWYSPDGKFTANAQDVYLEMSLKISDLRLQPHLPDASEYIQDSSISSALAIEIPQFCTKPQQHIHTDAMKSWCLYIYIVKPLI